MLAQRNLVAVPRPFRPKRDRQVARVEARVASHGDKQVGVAEAVGGTGVVSLAGSAIRGGVVLDADHGGTHQAAVQAAQALPLAAGHIPIHHVAHVVVHFQQFWRAGGSQRLLGGYAVS